MQSLEPPELLPVIWSPNRFDIHNQNLDELICTFQIGLQKPMREASWSRSVLCELPLF